MKRLTVTILLCLTLAMAGCSTIQSYQAGERGWQELAVASCQDLRLAGAAASAATAWSKVYFPNQEEAFSNTVEPLLYKIATGVDAYCSAVDAVKGAEDFLGLLQQKSKLLDFVDHLEVLLVELKGA